MIYCAVKKLTRFINKNSSSSVMLMQYNINDSLYSKPLTKHVEYHY